MSSSFEMILNKYNVPSLRSSPALSWRVPIAKFGQRM
jgi:hypothetical protein